VKCCSSALLCSFPATACHVWCEADPVCEAHVPLILAVVSCTVWHMWGAWVLQVPVPLAAGWLKATNRLTTWPTMPSVWVEAAARLKEGSVLARHALPSCRPLDTVRVTLPSCRARWGTAPERRSSMLCRVQHATCIRVWEGGVQPYLLIRGGVCPPCHAGVAYCFV
jgi:hypothetical protein